MEYIPKITLAIKDIIVYVRQMNKNQKIVEDIVKDLLDIEDDILRLQRNNSLQDQSLCEKLIEISVRIQLVRPTLEKINERMCILKCFCVKCDESKLKDCQIIVKKINQELVRKLNVINLEKLDRIMQVQNVQIEQGEQQQEQLKEQYNDMNQKLQDIIQTQAKQMNMKEYRKQIQNHQIEMKDLFSEYKKEFTQRMDQTIQVQNPTGEEVSLSTINSEDIENPMIQKQDIPFKHLKIILIGDSNIGKTCLLNRYIKNEFSENVGFTVGIEFCNKQFYTNNKIQIQGQFWDTAGQERFRSITQAYWRGTHIILLVFDLNSEQSLERLEYWIEQIETDSSNTRTFYFLGNKLDSSKENTQALSFEKIQSYLNKFKEKLKNQQTIYLNFTSAKTGDNIKSALELPIYQFLCQELNSSKSEFFADMGFTNNQKLQNPEKRKQYQSRCLLC